MADNITISDVDVAEVDRIVEKTGRDRHAAIAILHAIQRRYRYLPEAALKRVCEITDITPATLTGISTFYAQFRHRPIGRHLISMCHGTACHVKGAPLVHDALARHLGLKGDEDTDGQGVFTLQKVACLGCCTLAPCMQIDGVTYGHLTPESVTRCLRDFLELAKHQGVGKQFELGEGVDRGLAEIRIGVGSCCIAGGSLEVRTALEQTVRDLDAPAVIKPVGCVGMCHRTPLVEVVQAGGASSLYAKVSPEKAPAIVRKHFPASGVGRRLRSLASSSLDRWLAPDTWEPVLRYALDTRDTAVCAFLGPQRHLSTEASGNMDPIHLDEYAAHDGFKALEKVIRGMKPEEVVEAIAKSGLRGRGGAGFTTGMKWSIARKATDTPKYIVMNGDEGDPGAFMDRMLLESYPYRVLEGMTIAAYAIGAREGYLYIRAEYPLAVKRVEQALEVMKAKGLTGDRILGTDFSLNLKVVEGAGAFVCGEETALLLSIEGNRGMPRFRPPFPAEKGLWGKPTNINNVETLALVPWIIRNGPEAFAAMGTATSKGTKVFALAGKIARGGLIEVPMGITIRQIVDEIGGGVADGRALKAVQIGGPSGGCIPAELCDMPVDYEALTAAGAMMGSGGLVVLDDTTCMVDTARYFLQFTQNESCGKCTFCRLGTKRMLETLERICAGQGKAGDIEELERLARVTRTGSLCGLGKTAPNPVLTTLKYYRSEYEAHLAGKCPTGKCKALIHYRINDDCYGCTRCAQKCPSDAIPLKPYEKHEILQDKCIKCDTCRLVCPVQAVVIE